MSRRQKIMTAAALAEVLSNELDDESKLPYRGASAKSLVDYMIERPMAAAREWADLTRRAEAQAGALPVRCLDPGLVARSRWANRHASTYDSAEYLALKEEIRCSGGNIQPIKVRPLPVVSDGLLPGSTSVRLPNPQYEVVFGHRRHQACLELDLQVLALIEDVSDADLFTQMDRENRNRQSLSPWEQGLMYLQAVDAGLFSSMRQLAASVGCDPGTVSRAMSLAQLPEEVIQAFRSPTDLQYRWAKPLADALQRDRVAVLRRAKQARDVEALSPALIFASLIGLPPKAETRGESGLATLCHGGKRIGEVVRDAHQRTVVRFHRVLTAPEQSEVVRAIQQVFKKR